MMKFTVSAPGKIILAGEHAVVYGYKGIASSINLRCYASIIKQEINKSVCLHLQNLPFDFEMSEIEYKRLLSKIRRNNDFSPNSIKYQSIINEYIDEKMISRSIYDNEFIRQGLLVFIDLYIFIMRDYWQPFEISVNSEFSYGCGLGSSAAYGTVLATALLIISQKLGSITPTIEQLEVISSLAFRGEQIVHGTPSGIDNCISAFGGALLFQRTSQKVVRCSISAPHLPILIVDTRVKRCTKTVVNHVKKLMNKNPEKFHRDFSSINDITKDLVCQLTKTKPNSIEINQLVEDNQTLLESIGVSHYAIDDVIAILKEYSISAKLTGAGWGGCVFAFVEGITEKTLDNAMKSINDRGYGVQLTNLSCPGVNVQYFTNCQNFNT